MFDEFLKFFDVDKHIERTDDVYGAFLSQLGGMQFGDGLFSSFAAADSVRSSSHTEKWTKIAEGAYPELKGNIKLFGHDWLGRIFAVDLREIRKGQILMLEIGTGDALEIPCGLEDFLNQEIVLYADACLAKNFYGEWRALGNPAPKQGQCVGYKVPLFLGGADDVDNLENSGMEVYWGLLSQMKG